MTTATAEVKQDGNAGILEELSDPFVLLNTFRMTPERVQEALDATGYSPGQAAGMLEALREVNLTIHEGIVDGKIRPWSSRPVQQQASLALVRAGLANSLADDPGGQAAGLQQALLFLIALASSGWTGNLFACEWCGKVGVAGRSDKRFCNAVCCVYAGRQRQRQEKT